LVAGVTGFMWLLWTLNRMRWSGKRNIVPLGKVVVVTGAASGIGKATARLLVSLGCTVIAVDMAEERLREAFAGEERVVPLPADLTQPDQLEPLLRHLRDSTKPLFGIVNNAGIVSVPATLVDTTEENMQRVLQINTVAMWRVTKALFPFLQRTQEPLRPCVVNITSAAGLVASPFMGPYTMSKFAAEAFSDVLRREFSGMGIRVGVIEPFFVRTPILDIIEKEVDPKLHLSELIQHSQNYIKSLRMLEPERIAEEIANMLFTDPCPARKIIAYPKMYVLTKVLRWLPDKVVDFFIVNWIPKIFADK